MRDVKENSREKKKKKRMWILYRLNIKWNSLVVNKFDKGEVIVSGSELMHDRIH